MRTIKASFYFIAALVAGLGLQSAHAQFTQTNLVSDIPNVANVQDPNLINPWGISFSPTSPAWVADEGAGVATLYRSSANPPFTNIVPLVVSIPGGTPTGTVFNANGVTGAFNGDAFLFSSLNGGIFGWRGALGTTAETLVSPAAAVYSQWND